MSLDSYVAAWRRLKREAYRECRRTGMTRERARVWVEKQFRVGP